MDYLNVEEQNQIRIEMLNLISLQSVRTQLS